MSEGRGDVTHSGRRARSHARARHRVLRLYIEEGGVYADVAHCEDGYCYVSEREEVSKCTVRCPFCGERLDACSVYRDTLERLASGGDGGRDTGA